MSFPTVGASLISIDYKAAVYPAKVAQQLHLALTAGLHKKHVFGSLNLCRQIITTVSSRSNQEPV
jgi:hypothetical protein